MDMGSDETDTVNMQRYDFQDHTFYTTLTSLDYFLNICHKKEKSLSYTVSQLF